MKKYYYILYTLVIEDIHSSKEVYVATDKYFDDYEWEELGIEAYKQGLITKEDLLDVDDLLRISQKEYLKAIRTQNIKSNKEKDITKKKFYIPVSWEVWDKVEVEAENIEEAIDYVKKNLDVVIPFDAEPEYIDDSYKIEDGQNGKASLEDTIKYLKKNWNLSGGINGEEIS